MKHRKPTLPGEILFEEFMKPHGLSKGGLAKLIGVHRRRVHEIIEGTRQLSADTALRLSKLFKTTPEFWMNLQTQCDLFDCYQKIKSQKEYQNLKPLITLGLFPKEEPLFPTPIKGDLFSSPPLPEDENS